MILQRNDEPLKIEIVSDPVEIAKARAQREKFDRNAAWLRANAARVYSQHRGRVICISGEAVFSGATTEEALAAAIARFPDDEGRFVRYIPRERMERIYGGPWRVA